MKACRQIGMRVNYPDNWMELQREGNVRELNEVYENFMQQQGGKKPALVVCIVDRETNYACFKNFFASKNIPTQCVRKMNAEKGNMSVVSNVLKQMNPKVGISNYRVSVPKSVHAHTMILGIDVCHKPSLSIVGVAASYDAEFMNYCGNYLTQKKGKEIVDDLGPTLKKCFQRYVSVNGRTPEHIIVYRDGVGEQMRAHVMKSEIAVI